MKNIVYLINASSTNRYKIGVTSEERLHRRVKQLQTGSSDELVLVKNIKTKYATLIEKNLHALFNKHRTFGEWFELDNEHIKLFEEKCNELDGTFDSLEKSGNVYILKRLGKKDLLER